MRSSLLAIALALALPALPESADAAKKRLSASRTVRTQAADHVPYGRRDDVMRFAAEVAQRRGLDLAWVEGWLADARQVNTVARLVMPPPAGTAKNWAAYRDRFIEPRRVQAGARFWLDNEMWLADAQARFGVPAEMVVGIIGVETFYGRMTGNFRTLDALATLAFDFPSGRRDRSAYFRGELEELLVLAHRERIDLGTLRGSYAGALGLPQFMPSSINEHAIDFDNDGRIDLHGSAADAVGSVAHYLMRFGWQPGLPTHYAVQPPPDANGRALLLAPDIVPMFSADEFAQLGATLPEPARRHDGPLALVELENGGATPSYVAGTQNFYVVTRYNWSSYYALAVIELGAAVAAELGR